LIAKDHQSLSVVEYWVNEVRGVLKDAETLCDNGNDKIGFFIYDSAYDNVSKNISGEVKIISENKE
jgi:hypothetical protein